MNAGPDPEAPVTAETVIATPVAETQEQVVLPLAADSAKPWYALYTRHQHEKITARALAHKGFEVFLPLYNASHRWKDRTKKLSLPLFPCYVFLRGGLERRVEIVSTPGVHCLVRGGDGIAVIPDEEMDAVRQIVEGCLPAEPHPYLQAGDRVRIKSGSLMGLEGILLRQKDRFRLVVSVNLLRRSIAIEVDAEAVGIVSRAAPIPPRGAPKRGWQGQAYGGTRAVRRT